MNEITLKKPEDDRYRVQTVLLSDDGGLVNGWCEILADIGLFECPMKSSRDCKNCPCG